LLACASDVAACVKKREDQLRRKARETRTRVAKFIKADGGFLNIYCGL